MPKLSVTIIAKNEEQNLPRALASVASIADEIIVTDTGSTDRTVEIARQSGARVAHFDWIDDFSAAHNYCNSLATGDWLLMLDADEELLAESQSDLLRCLADDSAQAFRLLRQDLQDATHLDEYTEMWQVRLYRNRPDLRFVGRFHHQPALNANQSLQVRPSQVRLRHYGYLTGLQAEKNGRAARLLALELQDRPRQFYYLVELGVTLLAMGDANGLGHLAEAARMVVDRDPQTIRARGQMAILLEQVLANPLLPPDFPLSKSAARELALREFPSSVPLLWHLAAAHHAQRQFSECASLLERVVQLGESRSYDRQTSFDPSIMGDNAQLNLAVCYVRLGRLKDARQSFLKLVDSPTCGKKARENLNAIARLRRR